MTEDTQIGSGRDEGNENHREVETDKPLTFHPGNHTNQKLRLIQESILSVPQQSDLSGNVEFGIPLEEPPKSDEQCWSVLQFLDLIGGQERQEKKLNEVLEALCKLQASVHGLETKLDKTVDKIAKLDCLDDKKLTESSFGILNVGKTLIAMAEVLAKSLERRASPTAAKQQEPSSKRRKP